MRGGETDEPGGRAIEGVTKPAVPEVDVGPEIIGDFSCRKSHVERVNDRTPDGHHGDDFSGIDVTTVYCHRNPWVRREHLTETGIGRTRQPPDCSAFVQEPHGPYGRSVGSDCGESCNQGPGKEFFDFMVSTVPVPFGRLAPVLSCVAISAARFLALRGNIQVG